MSDLIDTTEMYLRTIFELDEEGVRPMRARIAEKLAQSGPTVSQTVARMQRDKLVELDLGDRHVVLTPEGKRLATRVMRKHRIAECLLVEVIGLPWEEVHAEACRWEHVMSDSVELRLLELLGHPRVSPFGNPIPGLADLVGAPDVKGAGLGTADVEEAGHGPSGVLPLPAALATGQSGVVEIVRIGETLQAQDGALALLLRAGVRPGARVMAVSRDGAFELGPEGATVTLGKAQAQGIFVGP